MSDTEPSAGNVPVPEPAEPAKDPQYESLTAVNGSVPVVVAPIVVQQSQPASLDNSQLLGLVQQYRADFESAFDGLRFRGQELQQSVQQQIDGAQLVSQKDLALAIVQDTSDVAAPSGLVLRSYLWSAVLLAGFGAASIFGTYLFAPLVHSVIGAFGLVALTLIGIPLFGLYQLKELHVAGGADPDVRMQLFGLALLEGVAFGSLVSERFLEEPAAFIFPLVIAAAYGPAQKSFGSSRVHLLGATVGGALVASLAVGGLLSELSVSYLFESLLLAGVSAVSLQFFFKTVQSEAEISTAHVHQLAYLSGVVLAKSISYFLLSHDVRDYERK